MEQKIGHPPTLKLIMTQLKTQLTLEEFLALPEGDITYELIDGEAKPKMSPKRFHSKLTLVLAMLLVQWGQNLGEVGIEGELCFELSHN